jgi:cell division control protein 6
LPRRSSVFKNRNSLFPRHIPSSLPHREYHMRMLHDLFTDFLEKPKESYQRIVQILGPIGSGKSCTAHRFGTELEKNANAHKIPLRVVHVSCKLGIDSRYALYQTVLQKVAPDIASRGYSTNEMLRQLVYHLRHSGEYLLLTLDDVDYLIRMSKEKKEEGGVVFDLTRLNEMFLGEYQQVVGVIFIARDASFKKLLDPSEVSTLGNVVIKMPSYSAEQLSDILKKRVNISFKPGTVDDAIVEFVAELTVGKSYNPGDCRFALDILLTSGLVADAELAQYVTLEHIRKAASESFDGISSEDLMALDEHAMLTLISSVQALSFYKTPYISMKDLYEYYLLACEDREVEPLSYSKIRDYVKDLHFRGLVNHNPEKGISIVGASVEDLSRVLQTIQRSKELEEEES